MVIGNNPPLQTSRTILGRKKPPVASTGRAGRRCGRRGRDVRSPERSLKRLQKSKFFGGGNGWVVGSCVSSQANELSQKQARGWRPKTAAASEGAGPAHT
jgi:hypothetical protein